VTGQRQDAEAEQAAAEAEQAAIDEWARDLVSTWPPLTAKQRERLRVLFDLSDGGTGREAG
jgi:hypothetical protein